MKNLGLFSLAALAFTSCGHHVGFHSSHVGFHTEPHYAQPSAIRCYGTHPLRHTVYYGSDEKWHYFESHRDLKLERYKVPRTSLKWQPVFPKGEGRVYVERNQRGELQATPPRRK